MKTPMLLATPILMAAISPGLAAAQTLSDDAVVYAAVLDSVFAGRSVGRLLVGASTDGAPRFDVMRETLREVLDSLPGLDRSALEGFERGSRSPAIISAIGETRIPAEIVDDSVLDAMPRGLLPAPPGSNSAPIQTFWRAFYERFPDTNGYTRFSPIGYSDDGNQAVLRIHFLCSSLCGQASLVVLQKTGDEWRVTSITLLWVH